MTVLELRDLSLSHATSWVSEPRQQLLKGSPIPPECGVTVWCDCDLEPRAYVSWQWTSLPTQFGGVIAILSPHAIESNIALIDASQMHLSPMKRVQEMSRLIHGLEWVSYAAHALAEKVKPPYDRRTAVTQTVSDQDHESASYPVR